MGRKAKHPAPIGRNTGPNEPRGILELDRFSEASLKQWRTLSEDIDELERVLFYALEPERRRLRPALIEVLQAANSTTPSFEFQDWVRLVTYSYSLNPLSAAGSLLGYGGRFNAGSDLEHGTFTPWPALYLAADFETGFREKFQMASDCASNGLSPSELALQPNASHVTVVVHGRLTRVFDATSPDKLSQIAQVLGRIKLPARAGQLQKRLQIARNLLYMVRTGKQLYDTVLKHNWRRLPVQFDLPAPSHVLAELVRAAGYEAILYASTKGPGNCLAVFPDVLREGSFIALKDKPPHPTTLTRLDTDTSETLAGWEVLLKRQGSTLPAKR